MFGLMHRIHRVDQPTTGVCSPFLCPSSRVRLCVHLVKVVIIIRETLTCLQMRLYDVWNLLQTKPGLWVVVRAQEDWEQADNSEGRRWGGLKMFHNKKLKINK